MSQPALIPVMPKPIRDIIEAAAHTHDLTLADIVGKGRTADVIDARHAAIKAVAEARPNVSSPALARWFGMHYTTVLYVLGRCQGKRGRDPKLLSRRLRSEVVPYLCDYLPPHWIVQEAPVIPRTGTEGWPQVAVYGERPGLKPAAWFLHVLGPSRGITKEEAVAGDMLGNLGFEVAAIRSMDDLRDMISVWGLPCRQDARSAAA